MEGYELNVIDYLLKPVSFERCLKAINKAQEQKKMLEVAQQKETTNRPSSPTTVTNNENDSIFVKGDKKIHQVPLTSILYLESLGSYVKIHLENESITTLDRLTNFENSLPKKQFLRIHRSYIVALKKIQTIEGNRLKIRGIYIPIGSVYKHNLDNILK
jgi:DNA-binding LytR/AlgR family response regulator